MAGTSTPRDPPAAGALRPRPARNPAPAARIALALALAALSAGGLQAEPVASVAVSPRIEETVFVKEAAFSNESAVVDRPGPRSAQNPVPQADAGDGSGPWAMLAAGLLVAGGIVRRRTP